MPQESMDEFDDVLTGAGDSLVASIVMLVAGIFSFFLTALSIRIVGGVSGAPVDGNFLVLSSSIVTAAVVVSAVKVATQ